MIKNEELKELIDNKMIEMQSHLNEVEIELLKVEGCNNMKISNSIGKVSKLYSDIAYFMGIFDKKPKV